MNKTWLMIAGLAGCGLLHAQDHGDEVFAHRGEGRITHQEFDARMGMIPEPDRAPFLREGKRLETMVANMLMRKQLVAEARAAGFDQDPIMQTQMELAAEAHLATTWLEHYIARQGEPDVEALAREYHMLHPQEFMTEQTVDVSHILISHAVRPPEEAEARAQKVLEELQADPGKFDAYVLEYSDDPSVPDNQGHFVNVKRGDMVEAFDKAAFSQEPGELPGLVKTSYGYHIIRVDKVNKARVKSWEEVRPELEERERARHFERVRADYLNGLANMETEMTGEAVRKMLERYFDPEALADWEAAESE